MQDREFESRTDVLGSVLHARAFSEAEIALSGYVARGTKFASTSQWICATGSIRSRHSAVMGH